MRGYLTSYIKESPFVLFRDGVSNSWPYAPFKIYLRQVLGIIIKKKGLKVKG